MPIFSRGDERVLFAHIPKTAGSSIAAWFLANRWQVSNLIVGDEDGIAGYMRKTHGITHFQLEGRQPENVAPQHATIDVLRMWGNFSCEFAVVRHPIARYRSQVKYAARKYFEKKGEDPSEERFRRICENYHDAVLGRINEKPHIEDNHFRPQTDFIDEKFQIFKLEDDEWRNAMTAKFGLTGAPPQLNASAFSGMGDVPLDDAKLAWLYDYYAVDFEKFGYTPDLPG